MKKTILSLVLFLLAITVPAWGVVYLDCDFNSAPSSEVTGGVYTCTTGSADLQVQDDGGPRGGCGMDHETTAGWQGSGGAKFCLPTSNPPQGGGSYRRIGDNSNVPSAASQMNIRYLMYIGPGGGELLNGKWHDNNSARGTSGVRQYLNYIAHASECSLQNSSPEISYNATVWVAHNGGSTSPCQGYKICEAPSTWDAQISDCTVTNTTEFRLSDWEEEWVVYEWERDSNGVVTIYIWTEDGSYNGEYYSVDTTYSGTVGKADAWMPYLQTSAGPNGEYFIIDEMVVANEYIGPPSGFGDPVDPPSPPTIQGMKYGGN